MRLGVAVVALALSGCASWSPFPGERLLARGDVLVEQGRYGDALAAYDQVLRRYPDGRIASTAAARRDVVGNLVATREEVARLKHELAARQTDVDRLSRELAAREAELAQLRADLESLKRAEMRFERRRQ